MLAAVGLATPSYAYEQYPAPSPFYPFRRSVLTSRLVTIPPYPDAFRVRVYNTPPRQPYYNVPPFPVVSPY